MRIVFTIPLIVACGGTSTSSVMENDPAPVVESMRATQPAPLVSLVEHTHKLIGIEPGCPSVTALPSSPDVLHEKWTGGCTMSDGTRVHGEMERFDGPNSAWLVGEDFRVERNELTTFLLDGAVTLHVSGDLWLLEAAASLCGIDSWKCTDGILGLDLSFTIYPAQGFPHDYDTTVSGVIAANSTPVTVDGAWSVDTSRCEVEPTNGMFTVSQGELHALTLNGAIACDGCGEWQVQGQPTPGLCGLTVQ